MSINVSNNGTFIGNQKFKVELIPKPNITITKSGKPYVVNQIQGVSLSTLRSLSVKSFADESFKKSNKQDAYYRTMKWEATLVRGKRVIKIKKYTAESAKLNAFMNIARSGDRIVVEVKDVRRKTFKGGKEKVEIPTTIFSIPIQ